MRSEPKATSLPRTVLMTADTVGGVWTYALELADALARRNVRTVLCTLGAPLRPDQRQDAAAVPGLDIRESSFKLEWMEQPWDDVARAGHWLLETAHEVEPDLIHLNHYAHGALMWPAPVVIVGHSCVSSWFEAVKHAPAPSEFDRYREEVRRALRAADLLVAPSAAMMRALEHHYGPLQHGLVIANARDRVCFSPAYKEPFILSAGRLWDEAKNVGALAAIADRLPWPVRVAGETREPSRMDAPNALSNARSIEPLGRLSAAALSEVMARASIYALPARYEPFGLSALEAAQSGCALVLGDIESLREVWSDAALFVDPDDPEALHAALMRLIGDAALRDRMALSARIRAQHYRANAMAEAYLRAYRQVLQSSVTLRRAPSSARAEIS